MDIQELRSKELILLECLSGSHAYGLEIETSDRDYKGVFILPEDRIFGLEYVPQVSDERHDVNFYELGRFIELLLRNNPNILEMVADEPSNVLQAHPVMRHVRAADFLSKQCLDTFVGYAREQIRKARGLNKKVVNPMPESRKVPSDFCYVVQGQGSVSLMNFLSEKRWEAGHCGLVNIPHARDLFALFYDPTGELQFRGFGKEASNDLPLSSVPKEMQPVAILSYNKDGYIRHCKDHKAYWDWVKLRNEARYEQNVKGGKNYDTKNIMHVFRLLGMAEDIAQKGELIVRRSEREFLLDIRFGKFRYEELMELAEARIKALDQAFEASSLPDHPDPAFAEALLVRMRREFYQSA